MKIIRVGLDVPLDQLFDYRCDDPAAAVGERVLVPFGRRRLVGVILETADESDIDPARLKSAIRILRDAPALADSELRLMRFAADYYHHPLGAVAMNALPGKLRRDVPTRTGSPSRYRLTNAGESASADALPKRASAQRGLLMQFQSERVLDAAAVRAVSPAALKVLLANGWVEALAAPADEPSGADLARDGKPRPDLTADQAAAVSAICEQLDRFRPHLLLGVTGSGKTEVYLRVIEAVLAQNRQALLLVPEIGLTPQLESTVRGRFPGVHTISLHSGLNATERWERWLAAQSGAARIVLGTRLAVFTPLASPGVILVDEEHDSSYKQADGLRYSARDLAVVRGRLLDIPVVLGSATPMLETYFNATSGRYALLPLRHRVNGPMPHIRCINTRQAALQHGIAPEMVSAISARLARREQVLLFINRRGYAPVLMCRACDWLSDCHRCSAQLVYHLADRHMHCHHCGHQALVPAACPKCGNADLVSIGQGTQRIHAALQDAFPAARILRVDRDSTRRRAAWQTMRKQIHAREVDILVGTQMLAKGHDFPHLNLVGVLNADSMLYSTDFRAPERLYALLTQVAGRAGRGDVRGEVLIQTDFPEHPLYEALRAQDYAGFADALLEDRKSAVLPPYCHQALLRAEAPRLKDAIRFLEEAADAGRATDFAITLYDPVPAAMMRVAGRERAQLLVESGSRRDLHAFLDAWRHHLAAGRGTRARWSLDVDPVEL